MPDWIQWLNESWKLIIVPAVVFAVFIIGGLWLRRILYGKFNRWAAKTEKVGLALFVAKLHGPFLFWFVLLGGYVAINISVLTIEIAGVINTVLLSLFVASWIWVAVSFSSDIGRQYSGQSIYYIISLAFLYNDDTSKLALKSVMFIQFNQCCNPVVEYV